MYSPILVYGLSGLAVLLQAAFDYGGPLAAVAALLATLVTVYGQWKQSKLKLAMDEAHKQYDADISAANVRQEATDAIVKAWQELSKERGREMVDMRLRLHKSETHTRICEHGQMKLVLQLVKAGVDIDAEAILDGLSKVELEMDALHATDAGKKDRETIAAMVSKEPTG